MSHTAAVAIDSPLPVIDSTAAYTSVTPAGRKWPTLFLRCRVPAEPGAVRLRVRGHAHRARPRRVRSGEVVVASSGRGEWGWRYRVAGRPRRRCGRRASSGPPRGETHP